MKPYPERIPITIQIEEIIAKCPKISDGTNGDLQCRECVLIGPCCEYCTGDASLNPEKENGMN